MDSFNRKHGREYHCFLLLIEKLEAMLRTTSVYLFVAQRDHGIDS